MFSKVYSNLFLSFFGAFWASKIYIAAERGHSEAVRVLVDAKASVNTPRDRGLTPCFIASQNGHETCVAVLLDAKCDLEAGVVDTRETPLYSASQVTVCVCGGARDAYCCGV